MASCGLCAVALLGEHPRSARCGSGAWMAGCFETHVSANDPSTRTTAKLRTNRGRSSAYQMCGC